MQREEAETIAVSALSFIAAEPDLLSRFLALTGIEAGDIRQAAAEPGFLAGVMQFILAHEPTVLRFSQASGIAPAAIGAALAALPHARRATISNPERNEAGLMSDDPETMRQIAELAESALPLLVLDVDDVILEFIRPFPVYLRERGFELKFDSFNLNGNIADLASGERIGKDHVSQLVDDFFDVQHDWQELAENAAETIAGLAGSAEIVLLTAMPHRHRARRRALLDNLDLPYPLVTTERAKGPAIKLLRGTHPRPVAFVDDMYHNLISARDAVADAHLFHLMADNSVRALLPPVPEGITQVAHWREAGPKIARALGV